MTNKEIKLVRSLAGKKFREELGLFAVEGDKMVQEALNSSFEVVNVYRREEIGEEVMARISTMSTPPPSLAVVRIPERRPEPLPEKGISLALDSVRDPGNLGTILRIADWFGVKSVFASSDTADIYNPKAIQASMGSIFRVDFHYCDLCMLADGYKAAGIGVFGTFLDGDNIYRQDLPSDALVVMGNEANGISDELSRHLDNRLTIPSAGAGAESLNVAVATAVTVSEFIRRI